MLGRLAEKWGRRPHELTRDLPALLFELEVGGELAWLEQQEKDCKAGALCGSFNPLAMSVAPGNETKP